MGVSSLSKCDEEKWDGLIILVHIQCGVTRIYCKSLQKNISKNYSISNIDEDDSTVPPLSVFLLSALNLIDSQDSLGEKLTLSNESLFIIGHRTALSRQVQILYSLTLKAE